ncbi:MarR family winged helix-turn-helix transcriptional regulator [Bacillus kexueae]|uniref:MarR family winged helix-turn-helix transcriptional regulator n=1 Tax=Aeribacillus kexueae TaxID=2078952 RepID=UPI001FB028A7|nr:MarR family transcriptional regulator [Bacillus kexueae]
MEQCDHLKLDHQLCFLIYASSREMTKLYRPILQELDITYPQYLALLVLWEKDGVSVKELGKKLYLDSGTLTPMLKRMEANELITRSRSTEDERTVFIFLTEKGKVLREKAKCIPNAIIEKAKVKEEELALLMPLLRSFLTKLNEE